MVSYSVTDLLVKLIFQNICVSLFVFIKFIMSFSLNCDSCSNVNSPLLLAVRVIRPSGKAISFASRNTVFNLSLSSYS